jgi:ATP-dependent protease ClpP protease subunit
MLNKAIARAQTVAEKFRALKNWKPGNIANRAADAKVATGEMYIYQCIGMDWWTGEGVTAKDVATALDGMKGVKVLNIYINSEGGDVFEAKTIYSQLQRFGAEKVMHIDGMCASAATLIAMAGDRIVNSLGATWMVHEAWGGAMGNASDLRAYADLLDMQNDDIASIYAKKTGASVDEMRTLMSAETWMNAKQSVDAKFADEVAGEDAPAEPSAAASKLPMSAAVNATAERLRLTQVERMQFVTAKLGAERAKALQAQHTRASPQKGATTASRRDA